MGRERRTRRPGRAVADSEVWVLTLEEKEAVVAATAAVATKVASRGLESCSTLQRGRSCGIPGKRSTSQVGGGG